MTTDFTIVIHETDAERFRKFAIDNHYADSAAAMKVLLDRANSMTFIEFEEQVRNVRKDPTMDYPGRLLYDANAMQSEAGEVGDAVKKYLRDSVSLDEPLLEECGDVLFYMKRLLKRRGLRVEDAAKSLLCKLKRIEKGI